MGKVAQQVTGTAARGRVLSAYAAVAARAMQGVGAFAESVLLAKSVLPEADARAVLLQWANHLAARNMCERAVQVR